MCVCVWEGGDRRGADGSSPVEGQVKRNETNSGLQDLPADGGMNQRHEPANEAIGQVHFDPSRHVQFDPSRHVQFEHSRHVQFDHSRHELAIICCTTKTIHARVRSERATYSGERSDHSGPPSLGRGSERAT